VEKLKASGVDIKVAKIAVMGCIVNGPGEAKDADLGIAGSKRGKVSLFKKGISIGIFPQEEAFTKLIEELKKS
jgi:(E)-4-hydroxy-3-methylbut-2-enyl-diphosphate synthase